MSGTIEGQVIDIRDSKPIEGAELALTGPENATTTSGPEGGFRFENLKEGEYELIASKPGFDKGIYGPLAVRPDCATKLTLALTPASE